MFKKIVIAMVLSMPLIAVAQSKITKPSDDNTSIGLYKKVFSNALSLQDNASALQACHLIVAIQGVNSPYLDTLAILYYNLGSYKQTLLLTQGLLQQQPNNITLLGITADSYNKLGAVKEATVNQEKLYQLQPSAFNGFNLAEMQVTLQRYAESLVTASKVLESKMDSSSVYYYQDSTGRRYKTPLKSAVYTLMGSAYFKQSNKVKAKEMLSKALQIDDKFLIARLNLEAIKED